MTINFQFTPFADWVVGWGRGVEGGRKGRFSRDPPPAFSAGGPCEQFWHGMRNGSVRWLISKAWILFLRDQKAESMCHRHRGGWKT